MSDDNKDDAKAEGEGEGAEQLTIRVKDQVSHSIVETHEDAPSGTTWQGWPIKSIGPS